MRHPAKTSAVVVLSLLAPLAACNRRPAEEAMKAAEQALAGAPEIAAYLPDESAAIAAALGDARIAFDEGRYTDALRAVQPLPDRIAAATADVASRKRQMADAWSTLHRELAARIEAIGARLAAVEAAGVPAERLAPAQAELAALRQAWDEAVQAEGRGETAKALASGAEAKSKADALASRLRMSPAPVVTPPPPAPR